MNELGGVISLVSIVSGVILLVIYIYRENIWKHELDQQQTKILSQLDHLTELYETNYLANVLETSRNISAVRDSGHLAPRVAFRDIYVNPFCVDDKGERFRLSVEFILNNKDHDFLCVGNAGSGKTSFLQYLRATVSESSLNKTEPRERVVPFYISLKTTQHLTESSLLKLCRTLAPTINLNLNEETYWENTLSKGRIIFLFDGLHEIQNDDVANQWLHSINTWSRDWHHCQFILTSRPERLSKVNIPQSFKQLTLTSFTDGQITEYIKKWTSKVFTDFSHILDDPSSYQQNIPTLRSLSLENIILSRPELNDLAKTPLLLTLMCATHYFTGAIPTNRTFIFKEVTSLLLSKLNFDIPKHKIENVLEKIAYRLVDTNTTAISQTQLKSIVEESAQDPFVDNSKREALLEWVFRSGLIRETQTNEFSFLHQSIHDIFTSRYNLHEDFSYDYLVKQLPDYRWRDVLVLSAESMDSVYKLCDLILGSETISSLDKVQIIGELLDASKQTSVEEKQAIVDRVLSEVIMFAKNTQKQQLLLLASPYISSMIQKAVSEEQTNG